MRHFVTIGCGLFVVLIAALHVLRPDLPPLERGISRYAGRDTLALATVALLSLAAAWVALAHHLRPRWPRAWVPLLVAAAGLLVAVGTPIGNPDPGVALLAVHTLGGLLFYGGTARAVLVVPATASTDRWLARVHATALSLFVLGAIGVPGAADAVGLLQRLVFATAVLWAVRRIVP